MIHELKILPEFYNAVKKGKKTFEIRTKDRPFKVNDHIVLKEWTGFDYTGEQIKVRIRYILDDENYLLKNTVAMSIEILDENIYPSATTEINIDYYNELKRKADFVDKMISPSANEIYNELEMLKEKADKWDEKETPVKPKEDEYGFNVCVKCDSLVESECGKIFNYCPNCGQRIG